jgi:hypothetical protein
LASQRKTAWLFCFCIIRASESQLCDKDHARTEKKQVLWETCLVVLIERFALLAFLPMDQIFPIFE